MKKLLIHKKTRSTIMNNVLIILTIKPVNMMH